MSFGFSGPLIGRTFGETGTRFRHIIANQTGIGNIVGPQARAIDPDDVNAQRIRSRPPG